MTTDDPDLPGRSPSKWAMLPLVLFCCACLGFAAYVAYAVQKELRYRDQGVRTTAQVIQKERHSGRHTHYVLKYRYQDSAKATFEGQGNVSLDLWEKSEEGHDLPIEYWRDEPSESRPVDSSFERWSGIVLGSCCVAYMGGIGLLMLCGLLCDAIETFRKRLRK
jgi:hypothetical protein